MAANLTKHAIWAVAVMAAVAMIARNVSESNIEHEKQSAFLGKACVDAGGTWQHEWNGRYNCLRPR